MPSIADLRAVFGQEPESVAEVSYGTMLPLEQWPDGEILLTAAIADRTAKVYLCPKDGRLSVQIDAPDPIVTLSFVNVERLAAQLGERPFRALSFTTGGQRRRQTFVLRTHPEIAFRSS